MDNEYIWSKGPFVNGYSKQSQLIPSSVEQIKNQIAVANVCGVLWIRNGDNASVYDLVKLYNFLDLLVRPVTLVTTDGVRPMPGSLPPKVTQGIVNCQNIKQWLTQNYDGSFVHPKLKHMPIGFDLHFEGTFIKGKGGIGKFNEILAIRKELSNNPKELKIYCDGHVPSGFKALSYTHPEREVLHKLLIRHNLSEIILQEKRLDFETVTRRYNKCVFALSPRGKGIDCHRTWELLLAGAIVITRTSSLDQMYIDNELPVVILKNWDELFQPGLQERMKEWKEKYESWTSLEHILPRLRYDWWLCDA
jgi:hypothetical protein